MKLFILAVIALNAHLICGQVLRSHNTVGRAVLGHGRVVHSGGLIGGGLIGSAQLGGLGLLQGGALVHGGGLALAQPIAVASRAHTLGGLGGVGLVNGGLLGGLALARGHVSQHVGPVSAAIETHRTVQVVDVPTSQDVIQPQTLIIEPNISPVNIEFRSQSSPVNVNQVHIPGRPGTHQATQSEEEPDVLRHEVVKPVVQEVRETIVPFRRITQEILPVQEEVNSIVARGQRQQVLAQPQVVAQPVAVAQRVAIAQPAIAVARPALAIAQPVGLGLVNTGVLGQGGLITTGINRFGGVVGLNRGLGGVVGLNGGLIRTSRL